jgi:glycosyltransferase involved in cell wall biosynthesis
MVHAARSRKDKWSKSVILETDDILVIGEQFWEGPLRVRHKMPLAWAARGNRVLWMEQAAFPPHDWRVRGRLHSAVVGRLNSVADRLWVGASPPGVPLMYSGGISGNALRALHRPLMYHRIRRYLRELSFAPRIVVLMQQAARHDILKHFPNCLTIYYCHDLYGYGGASAAVLREERRCCESVDVVFTTSEAHRRRLVQYNEHTFHIPHAVDIEWWESGYQVAPIEYSNIPKPRALYAGAVQSRKVDFGLLAECARARPNWNFVLVGRLEDESFAPGELKALRDASNVHLLGARPFQELPGYIAGADALMLPYRMGENYRMAGLAAKFYEYLVSGKPVLTTPYTEFETDSRDLLKIVEGVAAWIEALDVALAEVDPDKSNRRRDLARANSYSARIDMQQQLLSAYLHES